MHLKAYDFETTGVDPNKCEPLQVAIVEAVLFEDGSYEIEDKFETIIQIEADSVPEGAQKVHGISKEMTLSGAEPSIIQNLNGCVLGFNNWRYDDIIAKRYGANIGQSLDVFKLAQKAKRQNLLAKANLGYTYEAMTGNKAENAHDALADVIMTLDILKPLMQVLEIPTVLDAYTVMSNEVKYMVMPFGKYKGIQVKELPVSYVSWLRKNVPIYGELEEALNASFDL